MTAKTQTLGKYLRSLREDRDFTLEKLAVDLEREEGVKVGKPQLSHIENDNRHPNGQLLEGLIKRLNPSPEQLLDLQSICQRDNIGVDLPEQLRSLQTIDREIGTQRTVDQIHVIAECPIELMDISTNNEFVIGLAAQLKENSKDVQYIYWTVESSLMKFKNLFGFLEKQGAQPDVMEKTFKIVISPKQLSSLSYAIYSTFRDDMETSRVGRILIRNKTFGLTSASVQVTAMGQADVESTYQNLMDIYNSLSISESENYKLMSVSEIKSYK